MIHSEEPLGFSADFQVAGCFVESKGQILQLLRARNRAIEPEKWGSPAGRVFVFYPRARFEYFMFRLRFPYRPEIELSLEHAAYVWIQPSDVRSLDLMLDEWEVIKLAYQL